MLNLIKWANHRHTIHCFIKAIGSGHDSNHRDIIERIMKLNHLDIINCRHDNNVPLLSRSGSQKLISIYNANPADNPYFDVNKVTDYLFLEYVKKFMYRYSISKKVFSKSTGVKRNLSNVVINGMDASPGNKVIMSLLNDINHS